MIVHRYILSQILWPILAAFLSLNLLFLVVQLLKISEVAVGVGLRLTDLYKVTLFFLPGFAVVTIPIAVLTGVLLGFGRLAEDGELVALASAGISNARLAIVPMGLGLVAALVSLLIAGFVAPASTAALHQAFVDLSKRHVSESLNPGRFFEEIPGVVLYPREKASDGSGWNGFFMYDRRPGRARHVLVAKQAHVRPGKSGNYLELALQDGEVHARNKPEKIYSIARFEKARIGIDIDRLIYDRTRFISPTERLSLGQLAAAGHDQRLEPRQRARHLSAWHRRFAFPVAAVLFGLLGCALGGSGKLRGKRRTLLAAVVIVAAYYLLMRFSDTIVDKGFLNPGLSAWLPDVLVAFVVGWLMFRQARRPG